MNITNGLEQLRRLVIPAESSIDPDNVLYGNWIFLILRLELGQDLFALLVPVKFHQAKGLYRIEKRILIVFLQAYKEKEQRVVSLLLNQTDLLQ